MVAAVEVFIGLLIEIVLGLRSSNFTLLAGKATAPRMGAAMLYERLLCLMPFVEVMSCQLMIHWRCSRYRHVGDDVS